MNHGRHVSRSTRAPSVVSLSSTSSSASSPIRAPSTDLPNIQRAIQRVFRSNKLTIHQIERLRPRLHQVYLTRLTSGRTLVLKYPPHASTRILRHEKHSLETTLTTLLHLHSQLQPPLPIPQVYHSKSSTSVPTPYLLTSHLPGVPLTTLLPSLSTSEKSSIDRTLGTYNHAITTLTSPSFGLSHDVSTHKGHPSWRPAFHALLESALRDCEDMLVTLPYDSIRTYVGRHMHVLDEVHVARMVPMDLCEPDNVLVDARTKKVTGLVGFSNVLWGDPLVSGGVAGGSEAFWEGYGEGRGRGGMEGGETEMGARVRGLMYAIYRATVRIASVWYRPQVGVDDNEARRSLTAAVNALGRL